MVEAEEKTLREIKLATQTSLYLDIAAIIIVFVATLVCSRRKWKLGLYLMLGAYLVLYSLLVYFGRKPYNKPILHLDLFWSYKIAFDGFKIRHLSYAREILLNILVYIPLGVVLAAIFRDSKHLILWPVLIGLGLSVVTEAAQYVTRRGVTELDDVMDNGLGLLIGIGAYVLTERIMIEQEIDKEA